MLWGTMIELPGRPWSRVRSPRWPSSSLFGTNDLTQTAFGFSRDDIGKFLGLYEERKLVPANPFVTIDQPGVGRLMQIASRRAARPARPWGSAASTAATRLGPVLPRAGPGLCVLLAVPGARPAWPPGSRSPSRPPRPPSSRGRSCDKRA